MIEKGTKERAGDWFQTFTGKEFYILDPAIEDIDIIDIAHALSNQCRFNGHTLNFYSVAQHSVLVSQIVAPEFALWGLLHDAAEAYCGDVVRPIKKDIPFYAETEERLMKVIVEKFGLSPNTMPPEVKLADNIVLRTEKRDVCSKAPRDWHPAIEALDPLPDKITNWTPQRAVQAFLTRYYRLTGAQIKSFDPHRYAS